MARYGFTGTGAMAGNAIQEFLMRREQENQRRILQELAQQQQAEENRQRQADLALRQQSEARVGAYQTAQLDDLSNQREFTRATTLSENAMPGDGVDDPTRELLIRQGYGGQLSKTPGVVQQGPQTGVDEQDIPQYGVTQSPDSYAMRGGSKYLNARAAEDARAALATEAEAGRNERADADRSMRETIANLAASGSAASRALSDQLKQIQIETAQGKLDEQTTTRNNSVDAARQTTQSALDLATRLETHPGIGKATGAYEMRGFTQDAQNFNSIRNQLVAALALPNLGALKGPMSDKDILFVKQLATRLENPKIDDAETVRAIQEAKTFLQSKLADTAAVTAPAGAGGFRVVGKRPK